MAHHAIRSSSSICFPAAEALILLDMGNNSKDMDMDTVRGRSTLPAGKCQFIKLNK
jgi:hypothetical protein